MIVTLLATVSWGCEERLEDSAATSQENLAVTVDRAQEQHGPSQWALIVGIDAYEHREFSRLDCAVNDARVLSQILVDQFGYAPERIRFLHDGQATKAGIERAAESWPPREQLGHQDSLLVFFAGHGDFEEASQQGYLAAADSTKQSLETDGLPVAWFEQTIGGKPCRQKLLILDSCYSGALLRAQASHPLSADVRKRTTRQPSSAQAYWGMSSGRLQQVADAGGQKKHSVFTAALLEVLRNRTGSDRADQSFTFQELAVQVEAAVVGGANSRQVPNWGRLGPGTGDFRFVPAYRQETEETSATAHRDQLEIKRYAQELQTIVRALQRQDRRQAVERLRSLEPQDDEPDQRRFEWFYLRRQARDERPEREIGRYPGRVHQLRFSPDGELLAVACSEQGDTAGHVLVWDTSSGQLETDLPADGTGVVDVSFAPDGNRLAMTTGGALAVWSTERWERVFETVDERYGHREPLAHEDYRIGDSRICFLADGEHVILANTKSLRIWSLESKTLVRELPGRAPGMLSADGRLYAARVPNPGVPVAGALVWETKNWDTPQILATHGLFLALAPAGNLLLSAGAFQEEREYDESDHPFPALLDRATGTSRNLQRLPLAFSPDSTRMAAIGDGSLEIRDTRTDTHLITCREMGDLEICSAVFGPGGKRIALASNHRGYGAVPEAGVTLEFTVTLIDVRTD